MSIYPTLAEVNGLQIQKHVEGESILKLIKTLRQNGKHLLLQHLKKGIMRFVQKNIGTFVIKKEAKNCMTKSMTPMNGKT